VVERYIFADLDNTSAPGRNVKKLIEEIDGNAAKNSPCF
jgi:hypothetical protein